MKLFIAITTYEDKLYAQCFKSVLAGVKSLQDAGISYEVHYLSELYIDRARNMLADTFLKSDCTHMLFVDADIGFDENAVLKIIKHDKDFVAGSYCVKHDHECYPVVIDWSHNNNCKDKETGLVYAVSAPTGFMRLSRRVFEEMQRHYDLKPDNNGTVHFFDTGMKVFNDGKWWGEDTGFCHKWRNIGEGYEVFVEPDIDFVHVGNKEYVSNFDRYIKSTAANRIDEYSGQYNGFMNPVDMEILKQLAQECQDVVEVGCWKGKTTRMLVEAVKGRVHVVDHFNGSVGDETEIIAKLDKDIKAQFLKTVGGWDNLVIHEGASLEVAAKLNGERFDMVFIDADHSYEAVKADIKAWLPRCKKYLAGHDYDVKHGEVVRAVQELGDTHDVKVKGSIWWAKV